MKVSKRYLSEMLEMYELPSELYTMKRGIKFKGDLRYDITIIPPLIINGQYNKTKGHIHTSGHKEIYKVLDGTGLFILQKGLEFLTYKLKKGQKLEIPAKYYHATINPMRNKTLTLANWVHRNCVSDYKYIEKKKGMRFYYTTSGWVDNPNYK